LKWAQTQNGKIAGLPSDAFSEQGLEDIAEKRLHISNEYSNRVVHKWRTEEAAILVGTNTALLDDPELTSRHWPGLSPIRLVIDMNLKLPSSLKMFNDNKSFTIVFNAKRHDLQISPLQKGATGIGFYEVTHDVSLVHQVLNALYQLKIQSVLVEGGAKLLQSFIDEQLWDEARVITNSRLQVPDGLPAPSLAYHRLIAEEELIGDQIYYFVNSNKRLTL
jgi:diaminohydroxyphosphoribosylaminopyrimidine deaminase/5-amino-6-(5-phosphoribosylamino)uracil reductase